MFAGTFIGDRNRWRLSLLVSAVLHGAAVFLLLPHAPHAIIVTPSSVAHGDGPVAYRLTYIPLRGPEQAGGDDSEQPHLTAPRTHTAAAPARAKRRAQNPIVATAGEVGPKPVIAGTPFGSLAYGTTTGHDVRPALPVVFPDPPVSREERLALQGDVIVEVTIDASGNVVETKLLQSIGHGVDQKVIATVAQWRFKPAMMDGRPIASKHDVRFHYPS